MTESEIPGVVPLPANRQKCSDLSPGDSLFLYGFPAIAGPIDVEIPNPAKIKVTAIDGTTITIKNIGGAGNPDHGQSGGGGWGGQGNELCGIFTNILGNNTFIVENLSQVDLRAAVQEGMNGLKQTLAPLQAP